MKIRIVILSVFFCLTFVLSACNKESEKNEQPSVSISSQNNKQVKLQTSPEGNKKAKSNSEAFLEYAIRIAKGVDFMGCGDYSSYMIALGNEYKNDIVNPFTGIHDIGISNRTTSYFEIRDSEIYKADSIEFIAIDDFMTDLKEINTSDVVYCLNPVNKGCTIAFLLKDGIYIYEIDENGNKKNEIKHYFKDDGLGN